MPRKKEERPNVMYVATVAGTIVQPLPVHRTNAVRRGGDLIAPEIGMSKDQLYRRMDDAGRVWANSTWYALGKDAYGRLITFTSSANNWRTNAAIQDQLAAERRARVAQGGQLSGGINATRESNGRFTGRGLEATVGGDEQGG